ncbi:MAG: hypothetical protein KKA81_01010 [Bacteroidetes bacterium]|nr:hypothetical protein [Bacteroidota bacterium]
MKKLFFVLIAFLVSGALISQNNQQTTTQNGDQNYSTVTQVGLMNVSTVQQDETASNTPVGMRVTTVTQTGQENQSQVFQTETGGGGHGLLSTTLIQNGYKNIAYQSEYAPGSNSGQTEVATQVGDENEGRQVIAAGYTNSLRLFQNGNFNKSDQMLSANHSHGEVDQIGDHNEADQDIYGSNHGYGSAKVYIGQNGDYNYAKQHVSGGGLGHIQNAEIYQTGNNNIAEQRGHGNDFSLYLRQTGDYNIGRQYSMGNNNVAIMEQIGDHNDGAVTYNPVYFYNNVGYLNIQPYFDPVNNQFQDGGTNNNEFMRVQGDYNHTAQYQLGSYNQAVMYVYGDQNNAAQEQQGTYNYSEIKIYGVDGAQQGNGNYAMTKQTNSGISANQINHAYIIQGTENMFVQNNCAGISQDGFSMYGKIEQYGDYNWARVTQIGDSHISNVIQNGNSNFADINQSN